MNPKLSTARMDVPSLFPPGMLSRLRRNLFRWHERHGRHLPWRNEGDPYRVWISEIMLQQTTVTAVVPYYERFLARFPDLPSLAAADERDVLRMWEGLGYYSRARNIHKTARRLVTEFDAQFPRDVPTLLSLPGIGRYTAGAIASFAFDQSAPIVEANTLRLYCRLLACDGDPRSTQGQRLLWDFAEHVLPRRRAGEFNQALMDLGATVCVPTEPDCCRCPLRTCCAAFRDGRQQEVPRLVKPAPLTAVSEAAVAVHKRGAYLLRQRGESERWAGLWDFPRFELAAGIAANNHQQSGKEPSASQRTALSDRVRLLTGISIEAPIPLTTFKHTVTRYRITLHCLRAEYATGRLKRSSAPLQWVRPSRFELFPLSVTARKLATQIAATTAR